MYSIVTFDTSLKFTDPVWFSNDFAFCRRDSSLLFFFFALLSLCLLVLLKLLNELT